MVAPTAWQCFAPAHFLVSLHFKLLLRVLIPAKRPMDDVEFGLDRPQEDEFALLLDGPGSPYEFLAYPHERKSWQKWFQVAQSDRKVWLSKLKHFLRSVVFHRVRSTGKTPAFLLLKSPPHTARLELLYQSFPETRFVHLTRDPFHLFSSTRNMLHAMITTQALELPKEGLDQLIDKLVYQNFTDLYESYERESSKLRPDHLLTMKYEDLIAQPMEAIERIYKFAGLDLTSDVRSRFAQELDARRGYKPAKHELEPHLADQIRTRWKRYFELFGYDERLS